MDLWGRLHHFELGWLGLATLAAAFVLVLFLRRLLPAERRDRGRLSVLLLGLGPLLHLVATGLALAGAGGVSSALHIVNLFLVMLGVAGVLSMVVFDIALGRSSIPTIARDAALAITFLLFVFIALKSGGFDPLSVVTTSAVATAVIGLALQSVIANFFAGLLLQVERTFKTDDWIQIGPRVGKIAKIQWRSSTIVTRDGDAAVIPNSQFLVQEVVNLSRPAPGRRAVVRAPFSRKHPPAEVERALLEAARDVPGIALSPKPRASPAEFGPGRDITYSLRFWVQDVADEPAIEAEVRRRIWYCAERSRLEGPCNIDKKERRSKRALERRKQALTKVALFAPLEPEERDALARAMHRVRYAAGESMIREGEPGDSLFVVERGDVRVEAGPSKKEIAALHSGSFVGEMSLLTGEARRATCVTKTETVAYEIDSDAMRGIMTARPALAEEMVSLLAAREAELAGSRDADEAPSSDATAARKKKLFASVRSYFHLG